MLLQKRYYQIIHGYQINQCESELNINEDIIISCIHHPFTCYHKCERPTLSALQRNSDLVLSGHVHEQGNSARREGDSKETIFINAGAAYEKRDNQNGFNIIELSTDDLGGKVVFYKYLQTEHKWIQNKDINSETDGEFNFTIKKNTKINARQNSHKPVSSVTPKTSEKYVLVIDTSFDDLNRDKVNAILKHLQLYTNDLNTTITKMESGSLKIYFETSGDIPQSLKDQLDTIEGMRVIEISKLEDDEILLKTEKADKSVFHWRTFIKSEYSKTMDNPGATFTHSRVDELTLSDLFVPPNLKKIELIKKQKSRIDKIFSSDDVLSKKHNIPLRIVLYGEDNSGKSTLLKWWYDKYYTAGYLPILITGNEIKDISIEKFNKFLTSKFLKQYTDLLDGGIENYEKDRLILIIDDFHKIRFTKPKYKLNLISNINKAYQNIIIAGSDMMLYEANSSQNGYISKILNDFEKYQLIEFGPTLRYELIKKWCGLGSEQLESNELIRIIKETESHIESIIGKNFIPSYPIYLLTILQSIEASSVQKPEYSMHGFYYELLINESLNRAVKNKAEISLYHNYMTDYAYALFEKKIRLEEIPLEDFIGFHIKYCNEYNITMDYKIILNTLTDSKLIKYNDNNVCISYKYIYYFFVARYLANNISNENIRNIIKSLCQRLHRDEFASIVMFLTHLSKDQFIIKELLNNSKNIFRDYLPIRLDEDVSFINEMIKKLPEQIYKPISVEDAKQEELREEEELTLQEKEFDSSKDIYDYDLNEDISALDLISRLTRAVKTIEIVGQITKKYWGELKAPEKYELAEETYLLGLRTLGFYFSLVKRGPENLVEYLKHIYKKQHLNKDITKEEVDKASRDFLFGLCVMSSYGIIKRVTNAIGYDKLANTFKDILETHNYTSVKLIDTSIKLDYNEKFPWDEIKSLKKETESHFLGNVVLNNLVITYLRVFFTSIEDKQKICSLLGIKIDEQRLIDIQSAVKKDKLE